MANFKILKVIYYLDCLIITACDNTELFIGMRESNIINTTNMSINLRQHKRRSKEIMSSYSTITTKFTYFGTYLQVLPQLSCRIVSVDLDNMFGKCNT